MRHLHMLDLFSGLGGASAAMRDRGWVVTTVDADPRFLPTIVADMKRFRWASRRPIDLLWASPPCVEFSRESMPWCRTGRAPSMDLLEATLRVVRQVRPRFWIVENVRGAIRHFEPYLGKYFGHAGPVFLWGCPPPALALPHVEPYKERLSSAQRAERARIPYGISVAVAVAVEAAVGAQ